MLDALMEHIDDCNGIIRSFYSSSSDPNFKKHLKEFKKRVAPYRDHIGLIDNYIKHHQGRLRLIAFSWLNGSSIGYFVEGPVSSNGLGPVSKIHPGENTAFSYNRDIPLHLCNLYAVSSNLAAVLHSVDNRLTPLKKNDCSIEKSSELSKALSMAACLPLSFFEDELCKSVPSITESSKRFTVEYPTKKAKPLAIPERVRLGVTYQGDGNTRTFTMPYMGKR